MTIRELINKSDDLLQISDSEVLQNDGKISHKMAAAKFQEKYLKYKRQNVDELS